MTTLAIKVWLGYISADDSNASKIDSNSTGPISRGVSMAGNPSSFTNNNEYIPPDFACLGKIE